MRISDWSSDVCSSDLRLGLEADRGSRLDRGAQHVARRELDHAMLLLEARRLRTLTRPRRAQQNDVQRHGDPCLPYRVANAVARRSTPRNAALQFGLLDEVAILMREHVALDQIGRAHV